jgi:hypothetical protein
MKLTRALLRCAARFICNHAELSVVGCSTAVLPTLASCLARCPSIKLLVGGAGP